MSRLGLDEETMKKNMREQEMREKGQLDLTFED